MKAIICHRYGLEDLRLEDVAKPTPRDGEVLIQVRAASLNALDCGLIRGRPPILRLMLGLSRPRPRLGRDVAGRIESVGRGVTRFKPGDDVFGLCRGSLAEYACTPESYVVAKPANASFEEGAALPLAGLTALQGLRDAGRIQPGQRVLINGAAGGVGTYAVQIAKSLGAEVTGVCSTQNVEMVGSIGADRVVDYTRADFTRSGEHYDLIYDLVMNHSFSACRRVLSPRGTLVAAGVGGADGREFFRRLGRVLAGGLISRFTSQRMAFFVTRLSQEDLDTLSRLLESRKVTPVFDSRHRLSETTGAFRRIAGGHARGKVVVTVDPNGGRAQAGSGAC
jgi:NADPH:quinone reductase-like Zn-dependent oxidoreductase